MRSLRSLVPILHRFRSAPVSALMGPPLPKPVKMPNVARVDGASDALQMPKCRANRDTPKCKARTRTELEYRGLRYARMRMLGCVLCIATGCQQHDARRETGLGAARDPNAALDVPHEAPHALATDDAEHARRKVVPTGQPQLAFSLTLPTSWEEAAQTAKAPVGLFENKLLARFVANDRPGAATITIHAAHVDFELPIDTWLTSSVIAEGFRVASSEWYPGQTGLFFDLTATRSTAGAQVRRTSVRSQGNTIFSVSCESTRQEWERFKESCWAAHASFRTQAGFQSAHMERWLRAASLNPRFEISYPASWVASPVRGLVEGVAALDLRLRDTEDASLLAYLQVRAEPDARPNLRELSAEALARLQEAGFATDASEHAFSRREMVRAVSVLGWLGGFDLRGQLGGQALDARIGFIARKGITFSLALLSPSIENAPLLALRAARAFEIARSTLALSD
jgi:hypothetical protein